MSISTGKSSLSISGLIVLIVTVVAAGCAQAAAPVTSCTGVQLNPGDDIQAALNANPTGTTFCLAPGEYRQTSTLVPKTNQRLVGLGSQEARLIGAKRVAATQSGSYWVISGQKSLGTSSFADRTTDQQCRPVHGQNPGTMCIHKDQVFLDGVSLWQVSRLTDLTPGSFYWDYSRNLIYLRDDPTNRKLEVSVVPSAAINGSNPGVTIQNLVVEKFGNHASAGAISAGSNWRVVDNLVTNNHGAGIHVEGGNEIIGNSVIRNGQLGLHGGGGGRILVEGNNVEFNNNAGYSWAWEAGGMKFVKTDGLEFRNNIVSGNYGPGVWLDIENQNVLVENNTVSDNISAGIYQEIGGSAIIRNNVVERNGLLEPMQNSVFGAGIMIGESYDVEVYGNTVTNNEAGITALQRARGWSPLGVREVRNLNVHDNTITQSSGIAAGLFVERGQSSTYFTSKKIRWENNDYQLGNSTTGLHFLWTGKQLTLPQWKRYGHDDGRI